MVESVKKHQLNKRKPNVNGYPTGILPYTVQVVNSKGNGE